MTVLYAGTEMQRRALGVMEEQKIDNRRADRAKVARRGQEMQSAVERGSKCPV